MTKNVKLGPLESRLLFTLEEQGAIFFNFREAAEILKVSESSAQNVLFRLKQKSRITEIEKGKYALNPARSGLKGYWAEDAYLLLDYLLKDYYIGFWSALSHWGFTEQLPQTLFVATSVRKKEVRYGGQAIKFITISRDRLFGFVKINREGGAVKIASREKAILDALLYPQHCGGMIEAAKALWLSQGALDWEVLLEYLNRLRVSAVKRRLGYLLQVLGIEKGIRDDLEEHCRGFRWLDPSAPEKVKQYSKEWGLKLNLTEEDLLSWKGT